MHEQDTVNRIYSTEEVAKLSGFTMRQIGYWVKQGIITPSIQQAHGSGTRRRYSFDDLLQLRFVRQLMNHGWSMQKIREAITKLRDIMGEPNSLQKAVLVHGSHTILAICKVRGGERVILDALDPGGQQVMWIYLDTLREEAEYSISQSSHIQTKISSQQ
jgi:DNA-binding transcriptional MerR regulator